MYIYLSNENEAPVEVYFDDFKVDHVKSPVVQMDDYYPFGLTFNSFERENSLLNSFRFNAREVQDELGLYLYDYKKRFYDPAICRFISVDILAAEFPWWSPFQFAGLMPTKYVDLDGMEPAYLIPGTNRIVPASDQIRHTPPPNAEYLHTLTAEKVKANNESSKDVLSFVPLLGDGIDLNDAISNFNDGNYGMAILSGLSLIPAADVITKPLKLGLKHLDETIDVTQKVVKNSGGEDVVRSFVKNEDDLLKVAENAAGGSLDNFKEVKPGFYEGFVDGKRLQIEWQPGGHTSIVEGPHVKISQWVEGAGKNNWGKWKVQEKFFIEGQEQKRR